MVFNSFVGFEFPLLLSLITTTKVRIILDNKSETGEMDGKIRFLTKLTFVKVLG